MRSGKMSAASYGQEGGTAAIKDLMFGDEVLANRAHLEVSHPMENGIVTNWDDMTLLWEHTFRDRLGVADCTGRRILLTEAPLNPRRNRERMAETMFEHFAFGSMYVGVQAVLTLYAQGMQSGVVVDSGDGVTHIVPVYEGYAMPHLTRRLDVAGRDITRHLIKLLFHRGYALNRTAEFESAREMKERLCYVSADLAADRRLALETTVLMKDFAVSASYPLPHPMARRVQRSSRGGDAILCADG